MCLSMHSTSTLAQDRRKTQFIPFYFFASKWLNLSAWPSYIGPFGHFKSFYWSKSSCIPFIERIFTTKRCAKCQGNKESFVGREGETLPSYNCWIVLIIRWQFMLDTYLHCCTSIFVFWWKIAFQRESYSCSANLENPITWSSAFNFITVACSVSIF